MAENKKVRNKKDNKILCENSELWAWFSPELDKHISLAKKQRRLLRDDFKKAINYYLRNGYSDDEIKRFLSPDKLGGFYVHSPKKWYPLDNAAKIYPLSMKRNQMAVYRISAYLTEDIVPELLQLALTFMIKRFPGFATTVKRGFFWHYLDSIKIRFPVNPEDDIPCRSMNISQSGSPAFKVVYYKNRISLECFHVLADGAGAYIFLKTLTAEYLRLLGHNIPCTDGVWDISETPREAEMENAFEQAPEHKGTPGFSGSVAVQMSGKHSRVNPCQIIHFSIDTEKLKKISKKYGVTVTAYLVTLIFLAGKFATEENTGLFAIQIPVNMRKFYKSETIRNFSMYCSIAIPLEKITTFDEVLPEVDKQLREGSTMEKMSAMMRTTIKLVSSLRFVPLFIKKPIAEIVYGFLGDRIISTVFTNLGVISVPQEMNDYLTRFDAVAGANPVCKATCAMATFRDTAVLTITKSTKDPSFEEKILSLLQNDGLEPEITGSMLYEN